MRIAVAGAGAVGRSVAAELVDNGHKVLLIEREFTRYVPARVPGADWFLADACELSSLEEAQLQSCDVAIAATGDDKANLAMALLAKGEFGVGRMVARINDARNEWLFTEAWGVDVAVSTPLAMVAAVEGAMASKFRNNGQTCVNAKRFIVTEKNYDAFVKAYVEAMSALEMGDPREKSTKLGPMARGNLRDTLHEQVTKSVDRGATIACGGEIPDRTGYYYPATVLTDVKPGQPAYDEELFGPVASVIRAKDDVEAMHIANDSRFGLGGGIFSQDEDYAVNLARSHFDTGMVFINGFNVATPNMPFGGVKDSGYGREHGGFGMKEFVNIKAINVMG